MNSWKNMKDEELRMLLKKINSKEVNKMDSEGNTLLHHIAKRGINNELLHKLKDLGANALAKDKDGLTPLHMASSNGKEIFIHNYYKIFGTDAEKQKQMLKATDCYGDTPLHLAVMGRHIKVVELFIERGNYHSDDIINIKNRDGKTALALAIKNGDSEIATILEKYGGSL